MSSPEKVMCPKCQQELEMTINRAVTLTAHLEDDHRLPFMTVCEIVVRECQPKSYPFKPARGH